jgi:hypothetical protein
MSVSRKVSRRRRADDKEAIPENQHEVGVYFGSGHVCSSLSLRYGFTSLTPSRARSRSRKTPKALAYRAVKDLGGVWQFCRPFLIPPRSIDPPSPAPLE